MKEEVFYNESSKMLDQVAWVGGGCPVPGSMEGQVA